MIAEQALELRPLTKACSGIGRRRMRYPASKKLEIIRLAKQSHLPVPAPPFTTDMIFIDPAGLTPLEDRRSQRR